LPKPFGARIKGHNQKIFGIGFSYGASNGGRLYRENFK